MLFSKSNILIDILFSKMYGYLVIIILNNVHSNVIFIAIGYNLTVQN